MAKLINEPAIIEAVGNKPKIIKEFVGLVNTNTKQVSIAKMTSPAGWIEPGQIPEFDEFTLVLKGTLSVETKEKTFHVTAGQAIIISKDEWVRYSTPEPEGADYISVCLPAFSMETVHRDSN